MKIKRIVALLIPPIIFVLRDMCLSKKVKGENIVEIPSCKLNLYRFIKEIGRRKTICLQNIEELSRSFSFDDIISISIGDIEANFYGAYLTLEKYAQVPIFNLSPKSIVIQHGYVFEAGNWEKKKANYINFVWSSKVKEMMEEGSSNDKIIPIGAPFFYAHSILSKEEVENERKRLGKNLLAFPMHSTHFIDNNYDTRHFLKVLESQKEKFDTIRVCLYWKDIQRGTIKPYIDAGYECVCCGHLFDQFFLERQKALFEIADATISNGIGSHIGYSLYMHRPHWLVPDEFELVDIKGDEGKEDMQMFNESENYREVKDAFVNNDNYSITNEQLNIVDKYWGISEMKSQQEMARLIKKIS